MAKAYASLVSLINTTDLIQIHPLLSTCFNKDQVESLREKIDFLLDFVENHSDAAEAEDLVMRIAVVAHDAENIIEMEAADRIREEQSRTVAHDVENVIEVEAADQNREEQSRTIYRLRRKIKDMGSRIKYLVRRTRDASHEAADQVRAESTQSSSCSFFDNLQKIIIDMDSIKEDVIKAKEETGFFIPPPSSSSSTPPTTAAKTTSTAMVGFEGYVEQLLDQLTGYHPGQQIIPIVGMGGIGKTTLAKNVYKSLESAHHFDVCAWATVSQAFNAKDILSQALSCLGRSTSTSTTDHDYDQLGEELSKTLYGRRYLVILDDVWSVEAWEKIMFFFPENNNGSRIVVTTRQQELVEYFGSSAVVVKFLDDKNSWQLFCEKTFGQQGCPHPELEQVGKKIVKKCKGLPLAIDVIGGLLGTSLVQEYWEKIAEHKSLVLDSGEDSEVMSILYLSYKHLPIRLKPCFLYLGLFSEDYKIRVSQLIKLWVAEGFIKPNTEQSLEEIAECYVKELLDRNLILVCDLNAIKELESCSVHDLVGDMCARTAEREGLFCVGRDIDGRREYTVDEKRGWFSFSQTSSRTPSLVSNHRVKPFKSRLLKVLFSPDLQTILRQVNLRYVSWSCWSRSPNTLPSSIALLWSLQSLEIIGTSSTTIVAPAEIWMLPQLRHIQIGLIGLPDPPPKDDTIVLPNLQTLVAVRNLVFSDDICKSIPNIKELEIDYVFDGVGASSSCYQLQNVCCLNKLQVLRCTCKNSGDSLQNLKLPSSLKVLRLQGCKLESSKMGAIASLPHLHTLKLECDAVAGGEWSLSDEDKFLSLKYLSISDCDDLIKWNADSSNFPVLETLSLWWLSNLEEIPLGFGEIDTLETMYVFGCSESANFSAGQIVEEQENNGNDTLKLTLHVENKAETEQLLMNYFRSRQLRSDDSDQEDVGEE